MGNDEIRTINVVFLSARPVRAATSGEPEFLTKGAVSIRATRAGRDINARAASIIR